MLALATTIETLDGTVKPVQELIDEANQGIENHVYTCNLDGCIKPAKILSGSTAQSATIELLFHNGLRVICTEDQEFPVQSVGYKKATELTPEDFVTGCLFNKDNTLIFEHNTKIFLPSDCIVNEAYDLYPLMYEPRNILDILPEETGSIHEHLWIISTITINKDQLCNRLANDIFLKNMLSVDYLTYHEVDQLLEHFSMEYKQKTLSQDEKDLAQLLNVNTPDDVEGRLEGLLANLQDYPGDLFKKCGIEIEGELTNDHLLAASALVGYSNADHLTSVKHLHGLRVIAISEVSNTDVGSLVLDSGETIGLHYGVFARV
jgi:hypothetical protein